MRKVKKKRSIRSQLNKKYKNPTNPMRVIEDTKEVAPNPFGIQQKIISRDCANIAINYCDIFDRINPLASATASSRPIRVT